MYDALIIGAGFSGATVAEQLAKAGKKVLIIDKRGHLAGNAYDAHDRHGVLTHIYGPHIFHTNFERIFNYLSYFTEWRDYEHRVRAVVDENLYPLPVNQTTINKLYGLNLDEVGIKHYLQQVREPVDKVISSEDLVLSTLGRDLFDKFYRNYTVKQWGMEAADLKASVAARLPVRCNEDDRYFNDAFQFMPDKGYTQLITNMLDNKSIDIALGESFDSLRGKKKAKLIIFTGPVDEYFGYCFGRLPYRSLAFKHVHHSEKDQFQEVATVNYPNDHAYTRITEFKHLTGQCVPGTSIVYEYPQAKGDPFYPIPTETNQQLYRQYKNLAEAEKDVFFVGRLAQYRYYNMDQAVGAALSLADKLLNL
jgi:UDP-galactopyranose mutase